RPSVSRTGGACEVNTGAGALVPAAEDEVRRVHAQQSVRRVGEEVVDGGVAGPDAVVAAAADVDVRAGAAVEAVVAGTALQGVVADTAHQCIVAGAAVEQVVPGAADQGVVALLAVEDGLPGGAGAVVHDDQVVALAAEDLDRFAVAVDGRERPAVDLDERDRS